MIDSMKTTALFQKSDASLAYPYLIGYTYPWEALGAISDVILEIGATLSTEEYDRIGEDIWISKRATVAPSAFIGGPCIICEGDRKSVV